MSPQWTKRRDGVLHNYMKGITNETNQIIHTTSKRYW
jgi:hypothetical protein